MNTITSHISNLLCYLWFDKETHISITNRYDTPEEAVEGFYNGGLDECIVKDVLIVNRDMMNGSVEKDISSLY